MERLDMAAAISIVSVGLILGKDEIYSWLHMNMPCGNSALLEMNVLMAEHW